MRSTIRLLCLAAVLLPVFQAPPLAAQTVPAAQPLSVDSLYHPSRRTVTVDPLPATLRWRPDGSLLQEGTGAKLRGLARLAPPGWEPRPLLNRAQFMAAMTAAGVAGPAAEAAWLGPFTWNPAQDTFLVATGTDLCLVDPARAGARRITGSPEPREAPAFSPDGTRVAYLKGNDIYVTELETAKETRITSVDDPGRQNGRLDWLYREEIYRRTSPAAFWWSPDSRQIAFLSLDESEVPGFTLVDDRGPQRLITYPYPHPGEPEPAARLGVADLDGHVAWMEDPYPDQETLIVQVGWDPRGALVASYQDRAQTWLECLRFQDGKGQSLVREDGNGGWVDRLPLPVFLEDGGFLWLSARTGFHHLYRYDAKGRLARAVTAGSWDVRAVHGVDASGRVHFAATQRNPIGLDAYTADLEGPEPNGRMRRLTDRPGTHTLAFNADFSAAVDLWSDVETPPQQLLLNREGRVLRQVESPVSPGFKTLKRARVTFQQVPARDGVLLETMLVLPPDFSPARRYPVFQVVYGGPGRPLVRNAFDPDSLWYQFLAQQDIVTWICDNRSASAKGRASARGVYGALGAQELRDQLDGLAWLKAQGWADMDRIALCGESFGGFLGAYAMTHSKAWKLGILVAPVVDWQLYDSVYTERLMGLPADNPDGYRASSPLGAVADLSGKVMLVQGTLDENVHLQQTVQFLDALQKAGHPAPLTLLPGAGHSLRAPQHAWAMYQAIWEFLQHNL